MNYRINPKDMTKCIGCQTCVLVCAAANKADHSPEKSAIRIRTTGGMPTGIVAIVCRGCAEPACMEACPAAALEKRPGGGVLLTEEKCYGCRKCVAACSVRAVNFDKDTQKPIICTHCGVCSTFCTHDCLQMIEVEEADNA